MPETQAKPAFVGLSATKGGARRATLRTATFVLASLLVMLCAHGTSVAMVLVSEQVDPAGDATPPYCDIVAARIWQTDPCHYQLEIEVNGEIPRVDAPDAFIKYQWYIDTDQNSATGQKHWSIGSEFNARSYQTEQDTLNYGTIDVVGSVSASGGNITKFIVGSKSIMLLPFRRIGMQTTFDWSCMVADATGTRDTIQTKGTVYPAVEPFDAATLTRVVLEENLPLRDGRLVAVPAVYVQDCQGRPVTLSSTDALEYYPYFNRIDVRQDGLHAKPREYRSTPVAVRLNGRLSDNLVQVTSGSLWVSPPIQHLTSDPNDPGSGHLTVRARDAFGDDIALGSKNIVWDHPTGLSVESTSSPETIRVTALPGKEGLTSFRPAVDGVKARIAAHVRTTVRRYSLPDFAEYAGANVTFTLPGDLCLSYPHKITVDEMMSTYQVLDASDAVIGLEYFLTGKRSSEADRQFFNGILRDAAHSYCGVSGNPIILGFAQDQDYSSSCITLHSTGNPHWNVYFHECGHNATGCNSLLQRCLSQGPSPLGSVFSEASANICSLYAMWRLVNDPELAHLSATASQSLNAPGTYGGFAGRHDLYLSELARYESSPVLENVAVHTLDGIYTRLCDTYGWDRLPRFFSIFLPPSEEFSFDPGEHHATFVAACFSAAFQADLLCVCRDLWAFPVDEPFYYRILPELERRAALRDQ